MGGARRTFRSDNNAGMCPEALAALQEANSAGHATGYGDDAWTAEAVAQFRRIFGEETAVFFVATGTIANVLSIACLTEGWQRIICHSHSHLNDDESTAPELFTGCRVTTVEKRESKLTAEDVERAASVGRGDVHQPQAGVVSVSNPTEFGEVYSPEEMRAICEVAHARGYRVHVDGARFANAVAHLKCDPKAISCDAGVDALCFGGTKNGLALGEAALFFSQGDGSARARAARAFPFMRKRAGALLSKHRFVSAPFAATLADGSWLKHAAHANEMAGRLSAGLKGAGVEVPYSTDANAVFATLPEELDARLRERGHEYYMFGHPAWRLGRLMCSWDSAPEEVGEFLKDVEGAARRHEGT